MKKNRKNKNALLYRQVETLLRHYKNYKTGIKNLKVQLDYIMPSLTANYEFREGSTGTFVIYSPTEKYAIDRIESKRALDLHEKIKKYELIVQCIDDSLKDLTEDERRFVEIRYFDNKSIRYAADVLGYSERSIFNLRRDVLDKLKISLSGVINL